MKNLILSLAFTLIGTFAFASNGEVDKKVIETTPDGTIIEYVEEALFCKVERPDGTVVSCVLCNCRKLADKEQSLAEQG